MKHKTPATLACLLLALGVAACGDSSSSNLHTEASIEARTNEIQAEVAAIEATAQAILSLEPPPIVPTSTPTPGIASVAGTYSTIQLLERLKSSVVWINVELPGGEYFGGTGIVFSESGLTLTNHHVVAGATSISAVVTDVTGAEWTVHARFMVGDVYADLAVIQLDSLPSTAQSSWPARLGSIRDIKLGDEVVALGFSAPTGLAVTNGVVTSIRNDGVRDVIQHDAPIGPGNSGGPIVSGNGSVVGVNTYTLGNSPDENFGNIGVAITIEDAIAWIEQLEIQDSVPRPADVSYYRGTEFQFLEQYERAIEEFDDAVRLDPNFALAYVDRGIVGQAIGHHEQSVADLDEAIRLNPQLAKAYKTRGGVYLELGEYRRAIEDLDEAIRLEPRYFDAYLERGASYSELALYKRAIQDYDEAIRLYPTFAYTYFFRGFAYSELPLYERAIQDYDEAIRLFPTFVDAYVNKGLAYYDLGEYRRAITDLDEAIRLEPQAADAYYNRGIAYFELALYERVIRDTTEAVRLDPDLADAYFLRGMARDELGESEEAERDFQIAEDLGYVP